MVKTYRRAEHISSRRGQPHTHTLVTHCTYWKWIKFPNEKALLSQQPQPVCLLLTRTELCPADAQRPCSYLILHIIIFYLYISANNSAPVGVSESWRVLAPGTQGGHAVRFSHTHTHTGTPWALPSDTSCLPQKIWPFSAAPATFHIKYFCAHIHRLLQVWTPHTSSAAVLPLLAFFPPQPRVS